MIDNFIKHNINNCHLCRNQEGAFAVVVVVVVVVVVIVVVVVAVVVLRYQNQFCL